MRQRDDVPATTHAFLGTAGHASDLLGIVEVQSLRTGIPAFVELFSDADDDLSRFIGRPARRAGHIHDVAAREGVRWMIAVGYSVGRRALAEQVRQHGLSFATLIHPDATIGTNASVGVGSAVLAQAALSPLARVGQHAVVSQGASIGHDTIVQDFATIMPLAAVSGDCLIEHGALIGAGAVVAEKITVGANAVVGAGAVVLKDVVAGTTVVGAPARQIARGT